MKTVRSKINVTLAAISWGVLLGLVGCTPRIESGTIVAKDHKARWMQMIWTGKTSVPIWHPEKWEITIQGTANGKTVENEIRVNERTWSALKIGQQYTRNEE